MFSWCFYNCLLPSSLICRQLACFIMSGWLPDMSNPRFQNLFFELFNPPFWLSEAKTISVLSTPPHEMSLLTNGAWSKCSANWTLQCIPNCPIQIFISWYFINVPRNICCFCLKPKLSAFYLSVKATRNMVNFLSVVLLSKLGLQLHPSKWLLNYQKNGQYCAYTLCTSNFSEWIAFK